MNLQEFEWLEESGPTNPNMVAKVKQFLKKLYEQFMKFVNSIRTSVSKKFRKQNNEARETAAETESKKEYTKELGFSGFDVTLLEPTKIDDITDQIMKIINEIKSDTFMPKTSNLNLDATVSYKELLVKAKSHDIKRTSKANTKESESCFELIEALKKAIKIQSSKIARLVKENYEKNDDVSVETAQYLGHKLTMFNTLLKATIDLELQLSVAAKKMT